MFRLQAYCTETSHRSSGCRIAQGMTHRNAPGLVTDHPRPWPGFGLEAQRVGLARFNLFTGAAAAASGWMSAVFLVLAERLRRVGAALVAGDGLALVGRQRLQGRGRHPQLAPRP